MRPFFRPAIALMNSLSYAGKFGLVWLLSLLAIVFVVANLYVSLDKQIRQSRTELEGITISAPISRSIQLIQQHRGLSQGALSGQASMRSALQIKAVEANRALELVAALLSPNLKASADWQSAIALWAQIHPNQLDRHSAAESFLQHTRLIDRLLMFKVSVSGEYVLPLDPQIDSSYLIDVAINRLPIALEHLGQIRAHGTSVLASRNSSESQLVFLRSLTAQLAEDLKFIRSDLDRARRYNPALQENLLRVDRDVTEYAMQVIYSLESGILSKQLNESPEHFYAVTTKVIDQGYQHLYASLLPTINSLIQERIARAQATLYTTLVLVCILFLVVIYVSIGAYYATTGSINALARAAKAFAGGKLDERLQISTRDELQQVGQSFNEMAEGFSALLAARAEDERRHVAIVETALDAVVQVDARGIVKGWNPQAAAIFGWNKEEVCGRLLHELIIPGHRRDSYLESVKRLPRAEDGPLLRRRVELIGLHRDGREFPVEVSISAIKVGDGYEFSGFVRDITSKKNAEELIWRQAYYDELTGLPNRRLFYDRLQQEIEKARQEQFMIAVLFIDLDRFKEVNDTLGHRTGDVLLVEAAQRIKRCIRDDDTVARLGGDEFIILLSHLDQPDPIEAVAAAILDKLSQAFALENETVYLSASLGVSLYPRDALEVDDLVKQADQAMYLAKSQGRNRLSYFSLDLQRHAEERLHIINDLRSALDDDQFTIHYQPIIELKTGAIRKAEALIRWCHPQRGLISPAQFIPLAEESGLIVAIGDWVFRQATEQARQWETIYGSDIQISINKSPLQFKNSAQTLETWFEHLRAIGLDQSKVAIEITEGLLLDPEPLVHTKLQAFRDAGIQIAIDDFGTGYSSLSYLRTFDFDYLKIDRSFTQHLKPDANEMALCEAIIIMAHKLHMKVIAEGVETEAQRQLLSDAGCDYVQGYLFSKPLPAADFADLLARNQGLGATPASGRF